MKRKNLLKTATVMALLSAIGAVKSKDYIFHPYQKR